MTTDATLGVPQTELTEQAAVTDPSPEPYSAQYAPDSLIAHTLVDSGEAVRTSLRGVVTGPDGAVSGADVYLRMSPASSGRNADKPSLHPAAPPLTTTRTDESGRYQIDLPARSTAYTVDVGAVFNGLATQIRRDIKVPRHAPLDFDLTRGLSVTGFVVSDTPGTLPKQIVGRTTFRHLAQTKVVNGFHVNDSIWSHPDRFTSARRTECEVDPESGAFSLVGLAPGTYRLFTGGTNLAVNPPVVVESGQTNVLVKVTQALSFRVEAHDEQGSPHDKFSCLLAVSPASQPGHTKTITGVGRNGQLELAVPIPEHLKQAADFAGFQVRYRVRPHGHTQISGEVKWRPRDGPCVLRCQSGKATHGSVVIEAMYPDGREIASKLVAELTRPGAGTVSEVPLDKIGPYQWKAELPTSRWFIRIREDGLLSYTNGAPHEIAVQEEGSALLFGVVIPRGGIVLVRFGGAEIPKALLASSRRFAKQIQLTGRELRLRSVPPGAWTFKLPNGKERSIVVEPGQTHRIEF